MNPTGEDFLTEKEEEQLILSFLNARGEKGATEDEMLQVLNWALETRIGYAMLDACLEDKTIQIVDVKNGEVVFGLTESGKRYCEKKDNEY